MRRTSLLQLAVVLFSLTAGSAFALKPVKEFTPPSQPTAEELAESKARSKSNVNEFDQDLAAEPEPVPWLQILLVGIVFAGVAPFAWKAYQNTAAEMSGGRPTSARASRASDDN
ncbi:MAG TPA: hypothetical protein VK447_21420 [Myxococcaceae bacterium]|nr:hypothetical protein [Myxococcaceae bacterium]